MKKKLMDGVGMSNFFKLLKIMRLSAFFLLFFVFQTWASSSFSQQTRVTLNLKNVKVLDVLNEIENATNYYFLFNKDLVNIDRKVSVSADQKKIEEILTDLFTETNVKFVVSDRQIVLTTEMNGQLQSQQLSLIGKVTDSSGASLPGVTVVVKGTTNGTITDFDGKYNLSNLQTNAIIVFSFVGMKTQEIYVGGKTTIDIVMEEDAIGIEEVVAIGYGTQKKVNLTGAVSQVNNKMLENRPVANVLSAMQGATTGAVVTRVTGQPGIEDYDIQIRGLSSVNGSKALVIIDGVSGSLTSLNPNDIESISILKDAAATAIYGARAAGGVVLVTTKKGKDGKLMVEYSGLYGVQQPINMPKRIHSYEEAQMLNEAYVNAGQAKAWSDEEIGYMKDPNVNYIVNPTNPNAYKYYYDYDQTRDRSLIRGLSPMQNHNVSLRGGNAKEQYFFSLGYYDQKGLFAIGPDNTNRTNARFNYNRQLNNTFSIETRISYARTNTLSPSLAANGESGLLHQIFQYRTIYPVYLPGSNNEKYAANTVYAHAILNDGGKTDYRGDAINALVSLKANPLKNLTFTGTYSPNIIVGQTDLIQRTIFFWDINAITRYQFNPNLLKKTREFDIQNNLQLLADYDLKLGDKNKFHLLGGYAYESYRYNSTIATSKNLSSNDLFTLNLGNPLLASNTDEIKTWGLISYFGRLNYNFDNRLLFEANLRYDGSSKLAPGNRWQAFPSVSSAWRISNEEWFKNALPIINEFKLRASWGQQGNSDGVIGNYDYIALINSGPTYPFNNVVNNSYYQKDLSSEQKTWETIETTNIGLDLSLFKNKLLLTGDYFVKRNKDMLSPLQVSSVIGVNTSSYNLADMKTWGWEISLGWKDAIQSDFNYWINANVSDYKNKILKYNGQVSIGPGRNFAVEGMPYNPLYGYQAEGYFQTPEEVTAGAFQNSKTGVGDIKYKDLNNDGKINGGLNRLDDHGDLVYMGGYEPRYNYGFDFGFKWKGLDMSAFFQGVGKRNVLLHPNAIVPFLASYRQPWEIQKDYWTPENRDAKFPRLYVGGKHNADVSTHWLMNAAYLRLKNLQIGYTIPESLTQRINISKARIYISGQDLWEISKMWIKYFDPENPYYANFQYPFFRTYSVGLTVTF